MFSFNLMEQDYEDDEVKFSPLKAAMTLYLRSLKSHIAVEKDAQKIIEKVLIRIYFETKE